MTLRLKMRSAFPASVVATSPITVEKVGGTYRFGYDPADDLTVPGNLTVNGEIAGPLSVDSGADSLMKLGAISDAPTYNAISLNGDLTNVGGMGLQGGATSDDTLYIVSPGSVSINAAGTERLLINDTAVRASGRVFVGGAATNSGLVPDTTPDWLGSYFSFAASNYSWFSQFESLSTGGGGVLGGGRSTTATSDGAAVYGTLGFGYADNSSFATYAWGFYGEGHAVNSHAGAAFGAELAVVNRGSLVTIDPFGQSAATGQTIGLQLNSGNSFNATQQPGLIGASSALYIAQNGGTSNIPFRNGIVFGCTAINGTDGVTGTGEAIAFAKGHQLNWYYGTTTIGTSIYSSVAASGDKQTLLFSSAGMSLLNSLAATVLNSTTAGNLTAKTLASTAPTTQTGSTYTVLATDSSVIANRAGTVTLTLPSAATYPGRWLTVKTIQAQTVVSVASDVVPLIGGAAGTAILAATAGKWAQLQSDGTNWVIMAGN